jgi:hypothetical protein
MPVIIPLAAVIAVPLLVAILMLRWVAIGVGGFAESRAEPGPSLSTWADRQIGIPGFAALGVFVFATQSKSAGPIEAVVLSTPERTSMAVLVRPSSGTSESGRLVSSWADGAYVSTRFPRPRLLRTRKTSNALGLFGLTFAEAYATHDAAVSGLTQDRGLPLTVEDFDDAIATYRLAAQTSSGYFRRLSITLVPLAILEWALILLAMLSSRS